MTKPWNGIKMQNVEQYSALQLAYLGDAVFELLVRRHVFLKGLTPVNILNKKSRHLVNAQAQAKMYHQLQPLLQPDELAMMRRGRNAKSFTKAKNATVSEYRHATGVETLFGYLYAAGQIERLEDLFSFCISE